MLRGGGGQPPVGPEPSGRAPVRQPGARAGGGRGLTPLLAVLLLVGVSAVGGAVDLARGEGLDLVHGAAFVVACLAAAVLVQREHLAVPVFAPPLVYGGTALVAALATASARTPTVIAYEVFIRLILGAPVLLGGTALALLVVLFRRATQR